jgi:hypothetical protein
MPRGMSFWLTQQQMIDEVKDVTRRLGWKFLKPGDIVNAIEKCQGLKKGEKQVFLYPIQIISNRPEVLRTITQEECAREGFPDLTPVQFVEMFCGANGCSPAEEINRIEFKRFKEESVGRVVITHPFMGICAMVACAVDDATDEEILKVCNAKNPSGVSSGWSIVVRDNMAGLNGLPSKCKHYNDRTHFIVLC